MFPTSLILARVLSWLISNAGYMICHDLSWPLIGSSVGTKLFLLSWNAEHRKRKSVHMTSEALGGCLKMTLQTCVPVVLAHYRNDRLL